MERDPGYAWQYDDELSLADLVGALRRRWRIIVTVSLGALAVATAFALLRPDQYEYRGALQIGQQPDSEPENGRLIQPLEPPSQAIAQLENAWVPKAIRATRSAQSDAARPKEAPDVAVDSPANSLTLSLRVRGPERYGAFYRMTLERAMRSLIEDHQALYDNARGEYEARLEQARLALKKLQNETLFRIKLDAQQQEIDDAQRHRASLQSEQQVLASRLGKLDTRKKLLEERVDRLEGYIDAATERQTAATQGATSPTQAMSMMVLGDQLQGLRDRLADSREALEVDLPDQRETLQKNLADNKRAQQEAAARIERLELGLKGIRVEHENAIDNARQDVRELEARLESIQPTRVLAEPVRSFKPVGISGKIIVALGLVLGLGAGVVLALLVDAVANAQRRRPGPALADAGDVPVSAPDHRSDDDRRSSVSR